MTHIGYIKSIHREYGFGIILDAQKKAHCFALDSNLDLKIYTFVSFEGDGALVTDIIPLDSYPRFLRYQPNKTFYLQDGVGSLYKFFLVNKIGERYSLDGAEAFVVEYYLRINPYSHPK